MYTEHAKFQKASFNSNWDVKQWNQMFWIDTFISPNTFFCCNFSFGSIPSPHQVHSIAFLQQHLVGEVKVLIQNFLFHHVLHVGEGWRSRQVFHLERAGGQCFTNISCYFYLCNHKSNLHQIFLQQQNNDCTVDRKYNFCTWYKIAITRIFQDGNNMYNIACFR